LVFIALSSGFGCSGHATGDQHQVQDVDGMTIAVSARPGLPQDQGADDSSGAAQTGDNTLIVELRDDRSGAPIPDANLSAAPSTDLTGVQGAQSGRSQGNGVYFVPIRFAVPDTYQVTVLIDRTGHPESSAIFHITAG
jgi:hypothetical protein